MERGRFKMNKLEVTVNQLGSFRSAKLNGKLLSAFDLYSLLKIGVSHGMRLEYYLEKFSESHPDYEVVWWETDIT